MALEEKADKRDREQRQVIAQLEENAWRRCRQHRTRIARLTVRGENGDMPPTDAVLEKAAALQLLTEQESAPVSQTAPQNVAKHAEVAAENAAPGPADHRCC